MGIICCGSDAQHVLCAKNRSIAKSLIENEPIKPSPLRLLYSAGTRKNELIRQVCIAVLLVDDFVGHLISYIEETMATTVPHILTYVLLLTLSPLVSSNGIGCWGSKLCKQFVGYNQDPTRFFESINQTSDTAVFENGKNIACKNGVANNGIDGALCVWVWDTDNTTTGAVIKDRVQRIRNHGCKQCGAAPIVDDGSNDLGKGQVTIGWSWNEGHCVGVCNENGGSNLAPGYINPDVGLPPGTS